MCEFTYKINEIQLNLDLRSPSSKGKHNPFEPVPIFLKKRETDSGAQR